MTEIAPEGDTWQPVLDGELAAAARDAVDDIVAELAERSPVGEGGFKGDASTVLLLGHCGIPAAAGRLEAALVATASAPLTVGLFGGASAILWLLCNFAEGPAASAAIEHFDEALWRHVDVPRWEERHDLMNGLAGVGVLVAGRSHERARRIAERVLFHLEESAINCDAGAFWRTPPQFLPGARQVRFPHGMIDVGVAHGVPGLIGMLTQFVEAGIEPVRSRRLLEAAIGWLIDTVPKGQPRFGTSSPEAHPIKRIAWCYGDAGVAGVLLHASSVLGSPHLEREALDLMRQIAIPPSQSGVRDACFCHGAAGLAHIYNVAFQRCGDPQMRAEAERWLAEVLRMRIPGTGIAGYSSLRIGGPVPRWEDDPTLLTGVVGDRLGASRRDRGSRASLAAPLCIVMSKVTAAYGRMRSTVAGRSSTAASARRRTTSALRGALPSSRRGARCLRAS